MDINLVKKDFPIFKNNPDLIYLDSAATSQKPQAVIEAMNSYYQRYCANIHRGIYKISEKATSEHEGARHKIANFIGARAPEEIIFARNATEAINLVAYAWGGNVKKDDEIVTTIMEHHSNFVPWQELAFKTGAVFKIIDISEEGQLDLGVPKNQKSKRRDQRSLLPFDGIKNQKYNLKFKNKLVEIITKRTKILAITHVSNVLGTINPIKEIVRKVKRINPKCLVLVDGAQAVPHLKVDVKDLDADFYVFSGHKMLGPTGIGVLYGKKELLEAMPPFLFGGDMIRRVEIAKTEYNELPFKFEAGTPNIAGAIGLGAAVDYLEKVGMDKIREHERELTEYAFREIGKIRGIRVIGPRNVDQTGAVVSFVIEGIHPHDLASFLDQKNICLRSGHHCAMPLHQRLGMVASARASFYIYNSRSDIDKLVREIKIAQKKFKI